MAFLGGEKNSLLGSPGILEKGLNVLGLSTVDPRIKMAREQEAQYQQGLQSFLGSFEGAQLKEENPMLYSMMANGLVDPSQALGGQGATPAAIQEFQFMQGLSPEQKAEWFKNKRAQNPVNMGGYYGAYDPASRTIAPIQGGEKTLAPNETLPYKYGASAATAQGASDVRAANEPQIQSDITQAEVLGQAAAEKQVNAPKTTMKQAIDSEKVGELMGTIDDSLDQTGIFTAGFLGSMLRGIPGTKAKDLDANLTTIKANLGFDRLQQMRDASPTGGALGQVAIQELQALQASIKSLDQAQSPEQLAKNLIAVKDHYDNWKAVMGEYYGSQGASQPSTGVPEKYRKYLDE